MYAQGTVYFQKREYWAQWNADGKEPRGEAVGTEQEVDGSLKRQEMTAWALARKRDNSSP